MADMVSLMVKIGADTTELRKELNATQRQLRTAFGSKGLEFSKGAATMMAGLVAGLTGVGVAAVKMVGDLQMTKTAFTSMLGSAEKAGAFVKDLQKFAATTPFQFDQVSGAAQKFLAFGFAAKDVIPTLTAVGDAAAALGMSGEGIDRITLALGQMQAKGKVSGEEMKQLAETGIPVWQMLAKTLGVSVSEAMSMVSKGAVDAKTGLDSIMQGIEQRYSGMMEEQSKTIPGLISSIVDNTKQALQSLGGDLVESLNITEALSSLNQSLTTFTQSVQNLGLKEALRQLIPPELGVSIAAIGGAIMAVAVPALYSMAIAGWAAMAPFLPFIAIGAAVGAALFLVWKYADQLKAGFIKLGGSTSALSSMWTSLKTALASVGTALLHLISVSKPMIAILLTVGATVLWLAAKFYVAFMMTIAKVITTAAGVISWFANTVGAMYAWVGNECTWLGNMFLSLLDAVNNWSGGALDAVVGFVRSAIDWLDSIIGKIKEFIGILGQAQSAGSSGGGQHFAGDEDGDMDDMPISKSAPSAPPSGGGGGSHGGGGHGGRGINQLAQDAKSIHESIMNDWDEIYLTKKQQLDKWFEDEKKTLDDSKSANNNYQEDIVKLQEVYADKRKKLALEEAEAIRDVYNKVFDAKQNLLDGTQGVLTKGSEKELSDMSRAHEKTVHDIKNRWEDLSVQFEKYTQSEKDAFIAAANEQGIAYKLLEEGRIDLSMNANNEILAENQRYNDEVLQKHKDLTLAKLDIDEAYKQGRLDILQQTLDEETAIRMNDLDAQKNIMDTFKEAFLGEHMTMSQVIGNMYTESFKTMQGSISDVLIGTKTLGQAFQSLGQTIMKVLAQAAAKWIASRIMMAIFGKQQAVQQIAQANITGRAIAMAYQPAAAMVNMATMGGASVFASLGSFLGPSLGGFAGPKFADGGVVTGPTIGLIGEGRDPEAVFPLNDNTYGKLAKGINEQGGGGNITLNVSAIDASGFESWIRGRGGRVMKQYFASERQEFKLEGGI